MSQIASPNPEEEEVSIVDEIRDLIDDKLSAFKRSLSQEQQQYSMHLEKRLRPSSHDFKKKGNKVQWELNEKVISKCDETLETLQQEKVSVPITIQRVKEGKDLLVQRNKLIIIADSCDGGWATVNEYERRPVASDSDDDKRIRKADSAAIAKLAKKKSGFAKRKQVRPLYYPSCTAESTYPNPAWGNSGRGNSGYAGPQYASARRGVPADMCLQCGQRGHWKKFCPMLSSTSASVGAVSAGTRQ